MKCDYQKLYNESFDLYKKGHIEQAKSKVDGILNSLRSMFGLGKDEQFVKAGVQMTYLEHLKILQEQGYKYLTRNSLGEVWACSHLPYKGGIAWRVPAIRSCTSTELRRPLFCDYPCQWEDEEPLLIEDEIKRVERKCVVTQQPLKVVENNPDVVEQGKEDLVNSPSHYTFGGIETIDYMKAKATPEEFRGHLRLTALKYLSRAGHKDDTLQDYKKAQWYLNRLVKELESENNE